MPVILLFICLLIGILNLFMGISSLLVAKNPRKRYCETTTGRVVAYLVEDDFSRPLVEYRVGDETYRKTYRFSSIKKDPAKKGQDVWISEDGCLYIKDKVNLKSLSSAMKRLFPKGSQEEVFYNPKNPEDALVGHFPTSKRMLGMGGLLSAAIFFVISLLIYVFFI